MHGSRWSTPHPPCGAVLLFGAKPGALFFFANPLIDIRGCYLASAWLVGAQGARIDLQSLCQHRSCKLFGLHRCRK